jgi:hypothetical protein
MIKNYFGISLQNICLPKQTFLNNQSIKMKKIISAVLISAAFLTSSFAYSNNEKPGIPVNKEIPISSPFQRINVGSNLQLVLVQDPNKSTIVITGNENSVQAVNVRIDKGLLSITSKKYLKNNQVKIYVPVTTLTSLELASDASATTEGVVMLNDFVVLVHEGSKVTLHVLGNFEIEPAEGCDVVYEQYEKAKVVFIKR